MPAASAYTDETVAAIDHEAVGIAAAGEFALGALGANFAYCVPSR